MNTMKGFYASISSTFGPQGPYLEALAEIVKIDRTQMDALASDLGWQIW